MRRAARHLGQQIGTANHIVQRTRTDGGKDFTHLCRIKGNQIHNLIGIARELFAQRFVLGAHAHGACIRLALTHHDAAHRDQGGGADAVFLGPHHRRHYNIPPGTQTTIGAQRDALAQVVHGEYLMRLGQAHFPRQTGVFDRRGGGGTRAAIMPRNQDHIGLGLGHAGRDRADARRRHQLDSHLAARVDLLEIIDQLREILD